MLYSIPKNIYLLLATLFVLAPLSAQTNNTSAANVEARKAALTEIACPNFPQLVQAYQQRFQGKMQDWSQKNLSKANYQTAFYPFSGPDVVTVMSLYPKATSYVMVADQVPEYAYIDNPEKMNSQSQAFECSMLFNFSRRGYYLTNDLNGRNGPKPRFIKLLIYNIAFSGSKIEDIKALNIDRDGNIAIKELNQEAEGVRFNLLTKDGRKVTLDYLRADLSNAGFEAHPELEKVFSRKASQVVLIKSASHLLQYPKFSKMSEVLLANAKWVTQDETGLDVEPFANQFNLELYGKFIAAHPLWAKNESGHRLAKYFSAHPSKEELPFILGYEKVGGSILIVGERKELKK